MRCGWGQAPLVWDAGLEAAALAWASSCPTPGAAHDNSTTDGENVFFLSGGVTPFSGEVVTQLWASEVSSWACSTNTCADPNTQCLHFTQIVWFQTTLVGCAATSSCTGAFPVVYVCRYRVAGNRGALSPLGNTQLCALNGGGSCPTSTTTTVPPASTTAPSGTTTTSITGTTAPTSSTTSSPTTAPPYPPSCPVSPVIIKKIRPPSQVVQFLFEGMLDGLCPSPPLPPPCPKPCVGPDVLPHATQTLSHLVL